MHYAIIGNSSVSADMAREIRQKDDQAEISLFCPEGVLPYQRHLLAGLISGKKISEIVCVADDFFAVHRIRVVLDKKIAKIHPKRKRILTEDKEQIPFDILVIEDGGSVVFPDMKGAQKQGVFHLKTYSDVQNVLGYLGLFEIAVVEVDSVVGLQAACHLRKLNKEVIVIAPAGHLLSELIDKDVADHLVEQLHKLGIRFIFNNAIVEVLGDSDVKAVRLKTGKVMEAQFVVLAQAEQGLDLMNTDDLSKEETNHCVKYEDIYCVKDLEAVKGFSRQDGAVVSAQALMVHAGNVVATMFGQETTLINPVIEQSFDVGDMALCLLGFSKKNEHLVAYMKVDYRSNAYRKIFIQEGIVAGAVLINEPSVKPVFLTMITERASLGERGASIVDL